MVKILLTEEKIAKNLIYEAFGNMSDRIKLVKNYLDSNFVKAKRTVMGKDGTPETEEVVLWVDEFKKPVKPLTDVQLFEILQSRKEFKNMFEDDNERDEFLKDVIKAWYNNKIDKYDTILK